MTSAPTYRPCPACGSDQITDLTDLAPDPWRIGHCDACTFVYLRNPVDYTALEDNDLAWEKAYRETNRIRERKRGPIKKFARAVRNLGYKLRGDRQKRYTRHLGTGRMLDIGCANVIRMGPPNIPYGIELSTHLATEADHIMRAAGGYCLHGAGAERIHDFPENHFDGVMMHSYLEHEVNYRSVLDGTFRTLRPGGKAYIRVPNYSALNRRVSGAKWPGFRHPDHVNYFTPSTLRQAVERAGFHFRLINRSRIWLDDNILALAIKPGGVVT